MLLLYEKVIRFPIKIIIFLQFLQVHIKEKCWILPKTSEFLRAILLQIKASILELKNILQ